MIMWSALRHFPVNKQSKKNVAEAHIEDRGYILVRLINSSRGNVIKGLDEGIRQMTLGETSYLKVRFDYAYSSYCMGANIPPRSNIIFKVHLMAINNM
jgi:FKBP-type peptidyl-prolyl cis-trans isomerase